MSASAAFAPAQRALPLQGGRNFRDLGGYQTADGRRVRWGRVYRSGSMAELTPEDCQHLATLGIRLVCDLRTRSERESAPSAWRDAAAPRYWHRDYELSFGDLVRVMRSGTPSVEALRETMIGAYRQLPIEQAPSYRELFRHLAEGEVPVVIKCSAGKDRTGVAAALLLGALGVTREQILADYVLTNELLAQSRFSGQRAPQGLSLDAIRTVMRADPAYLQAALAAIEAAHGGIEGYLDDVLGIGRDALQAIRAQLLE